MPTNPTQDSAAEVARLRSENARLRKIAAEDSRNAEIDRHAIASMSGYRSPLMAYKLIDRAAIEDREDGRVDPRSVQAAVERFGREHPELVGSGPPSGSPAAMPRRPSTGTAGGYEETPEESLARCVDGLRQSGRYEAM